MSSSMGKQYSGETQCWCMNSTLEYHFIKGWKNGMHFEKHTSIERKVLYLVERKQRTLHFRLFFKIFFRFIRNWNIDSKFSLVILSIYKWPICMEVYVSQDSLFVMLFSLWDVLVVIRVSKSETLVRDKQFSGYGS